MDLKKMGKHFKEARTKYNQNGSQSPYDVESATDISNSTIYDLERGKKKSGPSAELIISLAQYYGVSADYLLGLDDDHHVKPSAVKETGLATEAVEKMKQQIGNTGLTIADFINKLLAPSDDLNENDRAEGYTCLFDILAHPITEFVQILAGEILTATNRRPEKEEVRLQVDADNFEDSIQPFFNGEAVIPIYVLRHYWKLKIEDLGKKMLCDAAIGLAFDRANILYDSHMEGCHYGEHSQN